MRTTVQPDVSVEDLVQLCLLSFPDCQGAPWQVAEAHPMQFGLQETEGMMSTGKDVDKSNKGREII